MTSMMAGGTFRVLLHRGHRKYSSVPLRPRLILSMRTTAQIAQWITLGKICRMIVIAHPDGHHAELFSLSDHDQHIHQSDSG
jgi:hypothetical protein